MKIREATSKDIDGISFVHVESWKTTYSGLLSDTILANLSIEKRKRNWAWTFNHLQKDEVIFVLEDHNSRIVGFISGGHSRDSHSDEDAELYTIYMFKEFQGNGHGKLLFHTLVNYLKQRQYRTLKVWVLKGNPAIHFYTHLGGKLIEQKNAKIGEDPVEELAFFWTDLDEIRV